MAEFEAKRTRLDQVRQRLTRWREEHGGRGQALPEELWAAAVQVAAAEGVASTARALRVDRGRLARRMERWSAGSVVAHEPTLLAANAAFVGPSGFQMVRF